MRKQVSKSKLQILKDLVNGSITLEELMTSDTSVVFILSSGLYRVSNVIMNQEQFEAWASALDRTIVVLPERPEAASNDAKRPRESTIGHVGEYVDSETLSDFKEAIAAVDEDEQEPTQPDLAADPDPEPKPRRLIPLKDRYEFNRRMNRRIFGQ